MPHGFFHRQIRTVALVAAVAALCGTVAGGVFALLRDLPQIRALQTFEPRAVSRIYSVDGTLISELFSVQRDPVPLRRVPRHLVNALIATEDRQFFEHSGVDLRGVFRAVARDILAGGFVEGASTITQQLAKTLFLSPRKTLLRKLREALLAFQIERRYTKHEILEFYLNQVYFGSGAYGVQSAAGTYFGKPIERLTLAEAALLAGMPKAPSRYSPRIDIEQARRRRNTVLAQMLEIGAIGRSDYETAEAEPIRLPKPELPGTRAPYFMDFVRRVLEEAIGPQRLYQGGLTITTSLDSGLQAAAEAAVAEGLAKLEDRRDPAGKLQPPQAAAVAIDVATGGILAMVGGRDYWQSPFNRATDARRQPGSAFKPMLYAYAIEQGMAQNQQVLDAPVVYKGTGPLGDWQPANFGGRYYGEMPLRKALALSQNIPAVRLMEQLGPEAVAGFAHALGIESPLAATLALALGASETHLLELTSAYSVFPRQGSRVDPFAVIQVVDRRGKILWKVRPEKQIAMSRAGAAVVTDMLQAVITSGTGRAAAGLPGPVAGKTGTTNGCRDALFIGFSPRKTVGVWVGRDNGQPLGPAETGARAALPIWIDIMGYTLQGEDVAYFDIPDDVVPAAIDPATGAAVPPEAPGALRALFVRGTEPRLPAENGG